MCASTDTSGSAEGSRGWPRSKPPCTAPLKALFVCTQECALAPQPRPVPAPPIPVQPRTAPPSSQSRQPVRACVPEGGSPPHIHDHGLHPVVLLRRPGLGLHAGPPAEQARSSGAGPGCSRLPVPGAPLSPSQWPWPRRGDASECTAAGQTSRPRQAASAPKVHPGGEAGGHDFRRHVCSGHAQLAGPPAKPGDHTAADVQRASLECIQLWHLAQQAEREGWVGGRGGQGSGEGAPRSWARTRRFCIRHRPQAGGCPQATPRPLLGWTCRMAQYSPRSSTNF